ncbi:prolipoprotein diacylglyceryl transferase [Caproiciproducens galactitolivorans]|uniref:Phosphatidylglycerol--prolipoprotein diacylglyceryl transferase n=1 Tax=Caproiciproducens galactitolivorans TaxID=642589 RepID=A0ABT4BR06_9FIRM|nr:prolipoprotein diacylglyceryl transferase [Caproiciproducens galactitolivorans]MCY1713234.1 prolipoprotein diacylglyceryl transferase [Caproiciproducens galactitolivorans]
MYHVQFPGLGFHFTINPNAFSIGGYSVKWYGVIIAVGFLLAFSYAMASCKKFNIDQDKLIDVIIVGMIGGIIGARAYYVIFDTSDQYLRNPISALYIWEGGLAIYGGIIGGMLCGSLMAKFRKISIPAVLDIASLGFLIGQAVGRWGNFVNQEAFGVETKLPWGMVSENTYAVTNNPVHPCFLYESLWCILGFVLLHIFSRKLRRYDGQVFLLYLIWYGVGRFFIEGLRTDSLITPVLPLRVSQVVAAATVLTGIILLIIFRSRTSLIGCGSAKVMELNAIVDEVPAVCIESGANEEIGNDAEKAEDSADSAPEESTQAEETSAGEPAAEETAEEVPAEEEKEATETNTK